MQPGQRHCVLGLIGGIGSGKSRVAGELARRGARVIVADDIGHQALRHPDVKANLVRRWGTDICDPTGEIDRRKVAAIVFADPADLRALEAEVFPFIERGIEAAIAQAKQEGVSLIVLDAAIMLETGWDRVCDWIVYVDAPHDQRLERLTCQRGWTEKQMQQRAAAQWPLTEKRKRADFVVDNSGTLEELSEQVDRLLAVVDLDFPLSPTGGEGQG